MVAPVVVREAPCSEAFMRDRARRATHETTFVWPLQGTPASARRFAIRWFTAAGETMLCGTGALAATRVVAALQEGARDAIVFASPFADVIGRVGAQNQVRARLPRFHHSPYEPSAELQRALRLKAPVRDAVVLHELEMVLLRLPAPHAVATLHPDSDALRAVDGDDLGAVIVTAKDAMRREVVYRYFTPWYGKEESPVAGSALALLGPYWSDRLQQHSFLSRQLSSRGASFQVTVEPNGVWIGAVVTPPHEA